MKKLFVGIDLGRYGGYGMIDESGELIDYGEMPYKMDNFDIKKMVEILSKLQEKYRLISTFEIINAIPGQSSVATQTFGKTIGEQAAPLKLLDIPYNEVSPTEWKKNVLKGMSWKPETVRFKAPKGATKEEIEELKKQHKKEHGSSNNKAKRESKKVSSEFVMKMFPKADIIRDNKYHDGIADAICLGYYGYLLDRGSLLKQ